MSIWPGQMISFERAKPVTTELLVIRMSRPFAAKPAANRVMMNRFFTWLYAGIDT